MPGNSREVWDVADHTSEYTKLSSVILTTAYLELLTTARGIGCMRKLRPLEDRVDIRSPR